MKNIELITIPDGDYTIGSTETQFEEITDKFPDIDRRLLEREIPQHSVHIADFEISKYPVTNLQFREFVDDTGYKTEAEKKGTGFVFTPGFEVIKGADWWHPQGPETSIKDKDLHPVVQVSWFDAVEFCAWLSHEKESRYRLPSEVEWEAAARGNDGRIFPWGNRWDSSICNSEYRIKDTTPVGQFSPDSDSPFGCADMCGNVFEWTSTSIGIEDPWPAKYRYPYISDDGREDMMDKNSRRVGRGGSYSRGETYCRCAFRFADNPSDRYSAQGFRVVREK
ncbi:formylglycine-generating enzyme family protein [Candidatus Dojkabacteria bacterium]|nr:formylglycine-generating enzyme family protein [Candidatus Dojkabacteria bacterium]